MLPLLPLTEGDEVLPPGKLLHEILAAQEMVCPKSTSFLLITMNILKNNDPYFHNFKAKYHLQECLGLRVTIMHQSVFSYTCPCPF